MQEVFIVENKNAFGMVFSSAEVAVQSIRLSYHKIAKVVPNALLTQCTVVFDDKRRKPIVEYIRRVPVYTKAEHL